MASLGASRCVRSTTIPRPRLQRRPQRRSVLPTALTAGLSTALGVGLVVASGAPAQATAGAATGEAVSASVPDPLGRDLYLDFDGASLLDALGVSDVVATVSSAGGGEVLPGPDRFAAGHSLRLEEFRPDEPATPAVVVVQPAPGAVDATQPGSGAFAFGAEFVLDAVTGTSATDNGDNLVQRGLFGAGAQYKIQLDDAVPSCRVAGTEGAVVVRGEPVQPEQWYRVRCRRVGDTVTLRVVTAEEGLKQVQEYAGQGPTGTLSYGAGDAPFSIGGKVDADGQVLVGSSDQFNGLVDDVFFRGRG